MGWFVGILEGKGNFERQGRWVRVAITNTDLDIIEACEEFFRRHLIGFTRSANRIKSGKLAYQLYVSNSSREVFQDATLLYKLIEPSMDCRLNEYQALIGASTTPRDPDVDVEWLAGIFEAEGTFSLIRDHTGVAKLKISMPNTNPRVIEKAVVTLRSLDCTWHLADVRRGHKPAGVITIAGMMRCQRFLNQMRERWVSERTRRRASCLLEFIERRLSRSQKEPYDSRELSLIQSVCDMNTR